MVLTTADKSIHGNTVHRIELSLHYLKDRALSQCLKDEFKINRDELACEENNSASFPQKNTPRLINLLIQN
jgi:hypothetical protein